MFLLKPFQLSTLSPSLSLSLCQNCRRQLRGAEGTGAAVIIDNYADLLTGCQQFVLSKLTADPRPPTEPKIPAEFPRETKTWREIFRRILIQI